MFSILLTLMIGIVLGQKVRVTIDPAFISDMRSLLSSVKESLVFRAGYESDDPSARVALADETTEPKKLKSRSLSTVAADT